MRVLVYSSMPGNMSDCLKKTVEVILPDQKCEILLKFDRLCQRLRKPRGDLSIAILHASNRKELSNLVSVRELLLDLRIILILPDREEKTVSMGYSLFPRFMTYQHEDFVAVTMQVGTVMSKMLEKVKDQSVYFLQTGNAKKNDG